MKLLVWAAGASLLALTACSETEVPVVEETAAATETAAPTAADGGPSTGTFQITGADGKVTIQVVAADGTTTTTDADGAVTKGTYVQESPNRWCGTNEGETEAKCFTETVGADGVWTSVNEKDAEDASTIVRMN